MDAEKIPNAADFMIRHVRTVTPAMSLAEVVSALLKHELPTAPVVEESHGGPPVLVGFVSEADCLEHLADEMFHGSPYEHRTARMIMKRHPICVAPETDAFALASVFATHGLRHLPVVDEEHRLLGIVSRRDVLRALDRFYREWSEQSDLERFPPDLRQVANMRFVMRGR